MFTDLHKSQLESMTPLMIAMTDLFRELKTKKVLLVDDDEWIRDSMRMFFEAEGCPVLALATAEDGLAALIGQNFDIIIADYRLPGMDGLTFIEQSQDLAPNSLKILITAYRSPEVAYKANKIGIHDLIEKPFTSATIEGSLSRLLDNTKKKEKRHDSKN